MTVSHNVSIMEYSTLANWITWR